MANLERFAAVVWGHWETENGQHRVLDVQFGADTKPATIAPPRTASACANSGSRSATTIAPRRSLESPQHSAVALPIKLTPI